MMTCEQHHGGVFVWDGRGSCPVCREIDTLEDQVKLLENDLDEAKAEIKEIASNKE